MIRPSAQGIRRHPVAAAAARRHVDGVLAHEEVAVIVLEVDNMRSSVREEVMAANRVASQLINRTVWLQAARGTPAMVMWLQSVGRVRSNEIRLFDSEGTERYRSPPSQYKSGRDAPAWFARLISPPPSEQSITFPDGKIVVQGTPGQLKAELRQRKNLDSEPTLDDVFLVLTGHGADSNGGAEAKS